MLHVQQQKPFGNDSPGQVIWRDGDIARAASMATYLVGIGTKNTYLYPGSTRTQYGTYHDRISEFKVYITRIARFFDDDIAEWRYIYAHRICDVRKCYPEAIDERPNTRW